MPTLSDKLKELSGLSGVSVKEHLQAATSVHPTALETATATVALLTSRFVENGMTHDDLIRLMASVLLGKVSGAGTGTEHFRDMADTKDRVVATVDNSGNRTSITYDAT